MPDFSKRSTAFEIMDDLNASGPVIDQTLKELEFINKWLGGNTVTLNGLHKILAGYPSRSLTIADLGCGGGDMLMLIDKQLKHRPLQASLVGIDANPNIVAYAVKNTANHPRITFKNLDIFSSDFQAERFDIVFATLFLHHFTREQLIEIFIQLKSIARHGIVVNDLHRHPLAFYSIKMLTKYFSKSAMVINDAPLSVLRGFTRTELKEILHAAGLRSYTLQWKWAFRWQLVINTR